MDATDLAVRLAAFDFLRSLVDLHGDSLPRDRLAIGFEFEGERVPLLGPQGIFKPAVMELPLSFTTVPPSERKKRPYADRLTDDGLLHYKYRGTDPNHRDNLGLRMAMQRGTPLVYFHGIVPGRYAVAFPVYIVGESRSDLAFTAQVDDARMLGPGQEAIAESEAPARRTYVTRTTVQRLHQSAFRERVLRAYRDSCAVCRLHHRQLLDAAHILPDADPRSEPRVRNGLALCKLHHAAFDRMFIGIRPDLVIEVRSDVLREDDGPMLLHGLKEHHGKPLMVTPRSAEHQPDRTFLEERYEEFRAAG